MSTGYSLHAYGEMVLDQPRMNAYVEALRCAVTSGCRVLDIGSGPGVFSFLAHEFGAGEVVAIDPDPSIVVAQATARRNDFGTIEFIEDVSTSLVGVEPFDVIISDLRGSLPFFESHIDAIADARERLLTPGGTMIPLADEIHGALVNAPDLYRPIDEPWRRNDIGLDLSPVREVMINQRRRVDVSDEVLATEPQCWTRLDYGEVTSADSDAQGTLRWTCQEEFVTHGVLLWFDCDVDGTNAYSNRPGERQSVYGQTFFPWQEPLAVPNGHDVVVSLSASSVNGTYVWAWDIAMSETPGGDPVRRRRQSSLHGEIVSTRELHRRRSDHVPTVESDAAADVLLLGLFDGTRDLRSIADEAVSARPDLFESEGHALARAGDLSVRYRT